MNNFEKYKKDLSELLKLGQGLFNSLQYSVFGDDIFKGLNDRSDLSDDDVGKVKRDFLSKLPSFEAEYNLWYSESCELIRQVLPNRLDDFVDHYKKPKATRKQITFENYVVQDALQGLKRTNGFDEIIVDTSAAIPRVSQQIAILKSVEARFKSSLFDIKSLMQADLLDSEIDAAQLLHKHKFYRAAGAICGVVLEKHLGEVCSQHNITFRKKNLTIADFNEALKKDGIIDTPKWRNIQFLADIRNKCDHNKSAEPTKDEVQDLIDGTAKVIKTIF